MHGFCNRSIDLYLTGLYDGCFGLKCSANAAVFFSMNKKIVEGFPLANYILEFASSLGFRL
jgi:hypothetical protein